MKEGRAWGQGCRAGYLRRLRQPQRLPRHLRGSARLAAQPQGVLGSWASARPTTPILRDQKPAHRHTYPAGYMSWSWGALSPGPGLMT